MKTTLSMFLAGAIAASGMMVACEADESAPSRPRTQSILPAPTEKAKENAEQRELEAPKRDLPTGGGSEYPGQSRATPAAPAPGEATVVTADAGAMQVVPYGSFRTATTDYNQDNYNNGPVPHIPENPGTTPMTGSTPVPNTPWSIDHSWGEVLQLQNYPHRAWPDEQTTYVAANVKNNPVYYFDLQPRLPIMQNNGSYATDVGTTAIEVPWFYANTAMLPILMVLEPPLMQRTSERLGSDPNYFGYLPSGGDIIPSPVPGIIKWEYPFLEKESRNPNDETFHEPATTQTDAIPPSTPEATPPAATQP